MRAGASLAKEIVRPASKSAKGALTQVKDVPTVPFKLIENFEGASRCGRRRRQGRRV